MTDQLKFLLILSTWITNICQVTHRCFFTLIISWNTFYSAVIGKRLCAAKAAMKHQTTSLFDPTVNSRVPGSTGTWTHLATLLYLSIVLIFFSFLANYPGLQQTSSISTSRTIIQDCLNSIYTYLYPQRFLPSLSFFFFVTKEKSFFLYLKLVSAPLSRSYALHTDVAPSVTSLPLIFVLSLDPFQQQFGLAL